jgi:hypothetical protein
MVAWQSNSSGDDILMRNGAAIGRDGTACQAARRLRLGA